MNLVNIGTDSGLSSELHQAITWTNADLFSIRPLGTQFSGFKSRYNTFISKKWHLWCCLQYFPHFVQIILITQYSMAPGIHFTRMVCTLNSNIQKFMLLLLSKITIRSCLYFAHVMTAELAWHLQTCDLIRLLVFSWNQRLFSQDLNNELIHLCDTCPWHVSLAAILGLLRGYHINANILWILQVFAEVSI